METPLRALRIKHRNHLIFSYININSIRYKFNDLNTFLSSDVDVLAIAETKIDSSFLDGQFYIPGFHKPFRLDKTSKSGGLLVYFRSHIAARLLTLYSLPNDIQIIPIEIILNKIKWLFFVIYRPPDQRLSYFIDNLSVMLEFYSARYDNLLIMGDFNELALSTDIERLSKEHNVKSLISSPTCFKSKMGDVLI